MISRLVTGSNYSPSNEGDEEAEVGRQIRAALLVLETETDTNSNSSPDYEKIHKNLTSAQDAFASRFPSSLSSTTTTKIQLLFLMQLIIISSCLFTCVTSILRPESDLTSHCYHFPAKDFGKDNNVKTTYGKSPKVIVKMGDLAIDFTLQTPQV